MTDFPAYTRDELDERARSIIRATQFDARGVRNADLAVGSDYDLWARLLGSVAFLIQETGKSALRALDKRQAFGAFLRQHASNAGIGATLQETSQAALRARGRIVVLTSTTANQTLLAGATLASPDGTLYTVDANAATVGVFFPRSFTSGHRSTRSLVFHGVTFQVGDLSGEIYRSAITNELFCIRENSIYPYHFCQPLLPLVLDPQPGEAFNRVQGVVASVTAVAAGASGNREPRDALLGAPWTGTFNSAQVLWIDGGRDALTPSQIQQAIRSLYGTRLEVMTLEEIRRAALETPRTDFREVYVFPGETSNGDGEFTVVPVGQTRSISTSVDGTDTSAHLSSVSTPVDSFVGRYPQYRAADWLVTARVSPGFAPDWKFNPDFAQTFSGASTVTRLKHTSALPTGLCAVGDRVIASLVRGAGNDEDACLVERRVTAVGADYLDVDAMPFAPTRAVVSQSGPYGDDFIAATDLFFDSQAPYIANQYRYPSPDVASAVEAYRASIARLDGVIDVVVNEPSGAAVLGNLEVFYPKSIALQVWT